MAAGSFLLWGLTPLYFKLVQGVSPIEVLAHRVVWSFFFLFLLLAFSGTLHKVWEIFYSPKKVMTLLTSAILVAMNWFIFIYSILTDQLMESSLGYFITPLVTILFGMIFLKERLNEPQRMALYLTVAAVLYQFINLGTLPFIALGIALTFSLYGLIRKQADIDTVVGLMVETFLVCPAAIMAMVILHGQGKLALTTSGPEIVTLLVLLGIVTPIPLLLYVGGSKRLPLSIVGFLQYISPTCQFFVATLVFKETVSPVKLTSFVIIWIALVVLLVGSLRRKVPQIETT